MKKLLSTLLAFAMMLAMFSGIVVFNASAAEVQMHIDFINQYTLEQAQQMGTKNTWAGGSSNSSNGSDYVFSKDDQGRTVITATVAPELSTEWNVSSLYFSTGTNATPYVKNGLIEGIDIFGDAELSNKSKIAFKWGGDTNFTSNFSNANLMFGSGSERVVISLQSPTKSNGYYIYDFSKMKLNNYDESAIDTIDKAFDGRVNTLTFAMVFRTPGIRVSFWLEDVYLVGTSDTVLLHQRIREAKEAGVSTTLITNAENVYKDTSSTQADVDAQVAILTAALSVNKGALIQLYNDVSGLDTAGEYVSELNAARAVINSTEATQEDVDAQIAILQPIYEALLAAIPAFDRGFTYTQLPGFQDWDDNLLALYNEQCELKVNGTTGTHAEFSTEHLRGKATKSLKLVQSSAPTPNAWTVGFSTCGNAEDKQAASQLGDVLGNYDTLKDIFKFDGIRIAVENANGDEPSLNTWDSSSEQKVQLRIVGSGTRSWDNGSLPYVSCTRYYRANDPEIAFNADYYDGYYYFFFKDFVSGWGGNAYEKYQSSNWKYSNLYFHLATGGINATNYNGGAIYISDIQFFNTPPEPTQDNLKDLVSRANELDAYGTYYDTISEASLIASNAASTAGQIEPYVYELLDIITGLEKSEDEARAELDSLITLADNLGMYTSSDPNYEAVLEADQAFADYSNTYGELAYHVNVMRGILSTEIFGDDLAGAMSSFYTKWRYNYTPASYAAFARAVDDVWADPENVDEDAAYAAVSAAAAALEKTRVNVSEESWFSGWTTELVQEVVDLNSEKLCDSIGDGLNIENQWNAGDFTDNTTFTAGDGWFAMTANSAFKGKEMGWKNMDRSGDNPSGMTNAGYPALNFTSIKKYGGIRLKLEVTGGTAERLLIGISNCQTLNREDYALKIKPEYVDDEGYINIPFTYFQKAWWTSARFATDELDDVIVFIVEAYNVTDGATVRISDVKAYSEVLIADNKVDLFNLINEAAELDTTDRYAAAIAEANMILLDDTATADQIAAEEELLNEVIASETYAGEEGYYFDSVSLPVFQEWIDADCADHNECANQSEVAISDKCLVGDAFQSIVAQGFGANAFTVSNCNAGEDINTDPAIGDPFEGFYTDFENYDGIRLAITNKYGLTPTLPDNAHVIFTLYGDGTEANAPYFTADYDLSKLERDPDFILIRFKDMIASSGSVPTFAALDASKQENYRLFTIKLTGTQIVNKNGELYFSDVQFFNKKEVLPREELIQLIENVKALDVDNLFEDDIIDAERLRDNIRATQEEIDSMVEWLREIYDALVDNGNFDTSDIVATFGAVADPSVNKSEGTIKLLMIGNSFSVNAYTYINQIAQAAGVNLIVANLNYPGCSLQQHADFMTNNKAVYGYQRSWGGSISDYTAAQALADYDWDYISIQQVSGKAGRPETYQPYMHTVVEYIKDQCPNAEIIWHQTWAYQKTSDHSDFPYFNKDQDYMWECIESTSKAKAAEEGITYIVPSGKAFQNARATAIGDNLNADGYHANDMGCYLAGYCFFTTITGNLPSTGSYRPSTISESDWRLLRRAVTDACTEYGYVTYRKDGRYIPALEKLKRNSSTKSIDGIMIAGNLISDSSDDLDSFKAINSDYIPGASVMFTLSEHDKALSTNAAVLYNSLLGDYYADDLEPAAQKRKGNRHVKVNGVDILGVVYEQLTDGFATYSDATLEWLDSELAAIGESDMPIFVVTSFPVNHTIGSRGASRICDVLNKYPNVVVFSGGTHEGVNNNLIIHNDGITYVNVGSLSDETANGLLVEVDGSGNIRIRRYDFITGAEYAWFIINADGSELEAYADGYYEAPVVNVEDGAEFDLANVEAPVMTWLQDGEKATLDGEPCAYGTAVTEAGEHTLVVNAGDKSTSVTFTVIGEVFEEPVVSIEDGAEFGIPGEPASATWTPEEATATLNGEEYIAGTVITELGEYTLVVTNGDKSVTVHFTIVDNYMVPEVSIEDGAEFKLSDFGEGPLVITWTPEEATATLNGEEYTHTHIEEPGEYTLVVTNGTKSVTINFTIVDDTPAPILSIEDGAEFDLYTAEQPICVTWTPEGATGTLNGEEYLSGTEITAVGEYTLTVVNGSKEVTVHFTVVDSTPVGKAGDMDGDGEITVADALRALRIAAKLAEPTADDLRIGDVDGDGEITVADALKILRVAAKLATEDSLIA